MTAKLFTCLGYLGQKLAKRANLIGAAALKVAGAVPPKVAKPCNHFCCHGQFGKLFCGKLRQGK
jgi:hypothetical protein